MGVFDLKEFVFRSNKVLPTEYDDALSYYEVLGKVANNLNDISAATNALANALVSPHENNVNYKVGDYVWYNNAIWKCSTANYGTFNPTDWGNEPVVFIESVGEEIVNFENEVRSDVLEFKVSVNTIMSQQQNLINRTIAGIARPYDPTVAYQMGDYVSYVTASGGIIYRAKYSGSAGVAPPDENKWASVVAVDEITEYAFRLWSDFFEHYEKTWGIAQGMGHANENAVSQYGVSETLDNISLKGRSVDFESTYYIPYSANVGEKVWVNSGESYIIPIKYAKQILLTAKPSNNCRYVFLVTCNPVARENMDTADEQTFTEIPPSSKKLIDVPLSANYLMVWKASADLIDTTPSELKIFSRVSTNYVEKPYYGRTEVNLSEQQIVRGGLNAYENNWLLLGGYNYAIPVRGYYAIELDSGNAETRYAFVRTIPSAGGAIDAPKGWLCTPIWLGHKVTIEIPQWANYVLIRQKTSSNTDTSPASCVLIDGCGKENTEKTERVEIFNYDLRNSEDYSGFTNYNSSRITANGYSCEAGYSNKVHVNKFVVSDDIGICADITTDSSSVFFLGSIDSGFSAAKHASCIAFDFSQNVAVFKTSANGGANFSGESEPTYSYEEVAMTNITGNKYRVEIGRTKRCPYLKVYNLTNGKLCCEKVLDIYYTYSSYGGKAGALYDKLIFGSLGGNVVVKSLKATVPYADTVFLGDSITEGSQLPYDQTWAYRVGQNGSTFINMGRGGGTIDHVLGIIDDIVVHVKPKLAIVTIGTNGGNTLAKLNSVITKLNAVGCRAIINKIPMMSTSVESVNAIIDSLKNCGADFATATASYFDVANGQRTSDFFPDRIHPNVQGSYNMYDQFVASCGEYI